MLVYADADVFSVRTFLAELLYEAFIDFHSIGPVDVSKYGIDADRLSSTDGKYDLEVDFASEVTDVIESVRNENLLLLLDDSFR